MNNIFKRINFRQPKYMLPAILYIPLLGTSYFFFDLFHTEKVEVQDKTLQTTEFLNPELPDAQIKGGDGIGSKYENMAKSWGKIQDYSAVDNIERDEPDNNQEEYESQYTEEDIALLDRQEKENDLAAEAADAKRREQEALAELEKALAEARLRGQREVMPSETDSTATAAPPDTMTQAKGTIDEESRSVKAPAETDKASEVVKKVKTASDYFRQRMSRKSCRGGPTRTRTAGVAYFRPPIRVVAEGTSATPFRVNRMRRERPCVVYLRRRPSMSSRRVPR